MDAVRLTAERLQHGECPVWWPDGSGLRLVDLLAGDLVRLVDGRLERDHVGSSAAAPRPRVGGGTVVGVGTEVLLLDADGAVVQRVPGLGADTGLRVNDGACDPSGRYWIGTCGGGDGAAGLHRLDPGGELVPVLTGLTTANGLGWAPDGRRAWFVDTPTGRVDVLDVSADGEVTGRRPFGGVPRGLPDGLVPDEAGGVWVALWDGGGVVRLGPDGEVDRVVDLPTPRATACTLGDDDLRTLYVTTSQHGLRDDDGCAGAVFTVRVDVPGRPVDAFAG
ncbi:SMP-30/gluconolactonase/LRE family protein [Angustibacter speluncae]